MKTIIATLIALAVIGCGALVIRTFVYTNPGVVQLEAVVDEGGPAASAYRAAISARLGALSVVK